jgi:hypothetical protein
MLLVGKLLVDSLRLWRLVGLVGGGAVLGLGLAGGFAAAAQEPDTAAQAGQTNDVAAAEALARLSEMVQSGDSAQAEDITASAEGPTATNAVAQANNSAQSQERLSSSNRFANPYRGQNDDRRSRGRRSPRSRSGQSGAFSSASDYSPGTDRSQTNGSLARLDYSAFKLIVDRNIFDPNRFPLRQGARPRPKSVDSLTLVGTMTYKKGTFAFFNGTSADYTKELKLNDVIAGYKITNIAHNGVQLAAGTNAVDLRVGMQLRREEDGPWLPSGQGGSFAVTPSSTSTNTMASASPDATSDAADSDIIKKLKQKRAQE